MSYCNEIFHYFRSKQISEVKKYEILKTPNPIVGVAIFAWYTISDVVIHVFMKNNILVIVDFITKIKKKMYKTYVIFLQSDSAEQLST